MFKLLKWLVIGGAVVVVIAVAAIFIPGLLGGPTTETPQGTVELFFDASEDMDADRVGNLFAPELRDDIRDEFEFVFGVIDSISFSNLKIEVVSKTEDTAEVRATYDWEMVAFGETEQYHDEGEVYQLEKRDGDWLISILSE